MNLDAWPEWGADAYMPWHGATSPSAVHGALQWDAYAQWDPHWCAAGGEFELLGEATLGDGLHEGADSPYPVVEGCGHQKLVVEPRSRAAAPPSLALLPSLASPLRVPLPSPLAADGSGLSDVALLLPELSPGLQPLAPESLRPAAEAKPRMLASPKKIEVPRELREYSEPKAPDPSPRAAQLPKPSAAAPAAPPDNLPQGLSICVPDAGCTRVQWRIDNFCAKLQPTMGRPLVSPPFAALGLPNLRLMVFPDVHEAVRSARSRERKGMYAAMVTKGPLTGALKLKADCLQGVTVLCFSLSVGSVRVGPVTYDFAKQAVHGVDDFGVDWLKQVDEGTGSLCVGIDLFEAGLGRRK